MQQLASAFSILKKWSHRAFKHTREDWHNQKYVFFGFIVLLFSTCTTVLYYLNAPYVEPGADTPSYLDTVQQLQLYAYPVHPVRLPIYPLFLVIIYAFAGQGNLMVVSIIQAILFILTAVQFYMLVSLITRRGWLSCLIALLVGTNVILLSYSKQIMTEGLSLWLLTTLVLFLICFLKTFNIRFFWSLLFFFILLCFTRPEWVSLPFPIYCFLWLAALRQGKGRYYLSRIVCSLGIIYCLIGSYIGINAFFNGYPGFSSVQNMNLLGKVLQYRMYHLAPDDPVSQDIKRRLIIYIEVEKRGRSPYQLIGNYAPDLGLHHAKLAGDFGQSIILRHPFEFLVKSIPPFFASLTAYAPVYHGANLPAMPGPFADPLNILLFFHRIIHNCNALFLFCAFAWILALCKRRTRSALSLEMGIVAIIALYAVVMTTLGGYYDHDYARVHTVFEPLILVTIWGTLGMGICALLSSLRFISFTPVEQAAIDKREKIEDKDDVKATSLHI